MQNEPFRPFFTVFFCKTTAINVCNRGWRTEGIWVFFLVCLGFFLHYMYLKIRNSITLAHSVIRREHLISEGGGSVRCENEVSPRQLLRSLPSFQPARQLHWTCSSALTVQRCSQPPFLSLQDVTSVRVRRKLLQDWAFTFLKMFRAELKRSCYKCPKPPNPIF